MWKALPHLAVVIWSSVFQGHSKKYVTEKCGTCFLIKSNAKFSPKSLGEGEFSVQMLGLFFQS